MTAPPKLGRPFRTGKPADSRITIRATEDERKAWERLAKGRPLSEWLRALANAAAGR